ncbi:ribonuclease H [Siphonobacter sp. BAB-5385]|uniref:Ribonuclease H n=1 Tax=Siphonobacter curvatus TaxID=2094562 RepID=A0A2S7IM01_9BACT|nr:MULTISPECIES: ribonuclease H family protein [Siphonobacter]OZI07832.1 ribonuclease H [Siphonobacter sp. BAB-5385]PMD94567.1 ribonuclease H [Siphonobacter sp. BAB-5405]PQA58752.1 ribonuclease H [Siphonobacter curvatus]
MSKKTKYYVVWQGRHPGIFDNWEDAKAQIEGFNGAQYKSFEDKQQAVMAFRENPYKHIGTAKKQPAAPKNASLVGKPITPALAVDAAWNTASGVMEYQGVEYPSGTLIFRMGPFADGTNNVGEFLAIVHGLAHLKKHNSPLPLYSDSRTAISWVRNKHANTKLPETDQNKILFELIDRAETWLKNNTFSTKILKWETEYWGENPADFGRK